MAMPFNSIITMHGGDDFHPQGGAPCRKLLDEELVGSAIFARALALSDISDVGVYGILTLFSHSFSPYPKLFEPGV